MTTPCPPTIPVQWIAQIASWKNNFLLSEIDFTLAPWQLEP
jgi:hypothetical protein